MQSMRSQKSDLIEQLNNNRDVICCTCNIRLLKMSENDLMHLFYIIIFDILQESNASPWRKGTNPPSLSRASQVSAGGKEHVCQCQRHKRHGFDPWVRKVPWRREWLPIPVYLPGESHGQSLASYNPWVHKESDTTEQLTLKSQVNQGQTWDSNPKGGPLGKRCPPCQET